MSWWIFPFVDTDIPLDRRSGIDLARRLKAGAVVHAVAVAFFAFGTQAGRRSPWSYALIVALLVCAAFRLTACSRVLKASDPEELIVWIRRLHATFYVQLSVWLVFLALAFYWSFGEIPAESILIICVAGTTATGTSVLAPSRAMSYFHLISQMAICLVWSLYAAAHYTAIIVGAVIAYTLVQVVVTAIQCRLTKEMFESQLRLEAAMSELAQSRDKAQQLAESRARFLATMSHEIRTPLSSLLGLTEILRDATLAPEYKELCGAMHLAGDHLRHIVDDILDHSKAMAGKIVIERIPFALRTLVHETGKTIQPLAEAKGLAFHLLVEPDAPQWVEGDPVRLRQILLNLLTNSIKFTSSGAIRLEAGTSVNGMVRFVVEDTGIGIPAENLELLFQDFTQADSSTTRRFGGTGLGLSITRHLVQLMNGTVEVQSNPGEGTRLVIQVPLPVAAMPEPAAAEHAGSIAGLRVLVAEDNPVNRHIARALIEKAGAMAVDLASSAEEAIRMHADAPYQLIVMDCNLPGIDGCEATRVIRRMDGDASRVPIIALSASGSPEDRDRCMASGMNGHLTKPIRRESLEALLSQFAGSSRQDA